MPEHNKTEANVYFKIRTIIPFMLILLAFTLVLATAVGAVYVPFLKTLKIILKNWGIINMGGFSREQELIIFFVRFPRILVAALVGAALGTSGAVMQGMFRNPMADPGIIGVSSGAGLGAVLAITLGLTARNIYFMPAFATAGAIIAAAVIFILSARKGKIPVLTLILAGIAVSTFLGAITSFLLTIINDYQVRLFLSWTMGGLKDRSWEHVNLVAVEIIVCILILFTFAKDLNILLLGEEEAQSLGLSPSGTRKLLLLIVSITTAMAVSVSGSISFVGLMVPHIIRLIVGPDHRILLPASAVGGSVFLVACDLVSRVFPAEIGVGIVTSMLGAPYFLYLLIRARREGGELL